jgi:hypothetical protein
MRIYFRDDVENLITFHDKVVKYEQALNRHISFLQIL